MSPVWQATHLCLPILVCMKTWASLVQVLSDVQALNVKITTQWNTENWTRNTRSLVQNSVLMVTNIFVHQSRLLFSMNRLRISTELSAILIEVFVMFLIFSTRIPGKYMDTAGLRSLGCRDRRFESYSMQGCLFVCVLLFYIFVVICR
jgi:hypothetical protein